MTEEEWGQLWAERAKQEGHRPLHLSQPMTAAETKLNATRRQKAGVTAEKLRKLAEQGVWLTDAAHAIGVSPSTAKNLAVKHNIPFKRGHKSYARHD